jgi:murein DD-endopeptidase MepM/ murein hydrolase activator NlpD
MITVNKIDNLEYTIPYARITIGKIGDKSSDVYEVGDGKLISYDVTSSEGSNLNNVNFNILDLDNSIIDKYLTYVESVNGLDSIETTPTPISQVDNTLVNVPQDAAITNGNNKVIYTSTKASVFNDPVGSRGNKLTPNETFGCAMRYQNAAAAKQFGSAGMIPYLKFGDKVKVTYPTTGKSCVCQILDWGANPRYLDRGIDLFTKAFNYLTNTSGYSGAVNIGIINGVKIELIESTGTSAIPVDNPSTVKKIPTPVVQNKPIIKAKTGAQITIELGFNGKIFVANSFIHTGLSYDHSTRIFSFSGQASTWSMTQRIKNNGFTNVTFKQIATKITKSYNLQLEMEDDGVVYEYFPQRGISDYKTLVTEAKRLGYTVNTVGNKLIIKKQESSIASKDTFKLIYGANAGTKFTISHNASSDGSGGARSSTPGANATTGELKYDFNPDTGNIEQIRKEDNTANKDSNATTGSAISEPKPKIYKNNNPTSDKENSLRVKGILANAEFPTTPESLFLTPDTPFKTEGFSKTIDRYWVVDSVKHTYDLGTSYTSVSLYSPLKNKNPSPTTTTSTNISSSPSFTLPPNNITTPVVSNGGKLTFIRPTSGVITSKHRTENSRRPNHKGIDYGASGGTPVVASAAGTITNAVTGCRVGSTSCGGGYGNVVYIDHGDGWSSRYAHLSSVAVTSGTVTQGQIIGYVGNTGHSFGNHLHFEIRKNGGDLNPRTFIPN